MGLDNGIPDGKEFCKKCNKDTAHRTIKICTEHFTSDHYDDSNMWLFGKRQKE